MATPTRPPANSFVRVMRKIYGPIGFSKGYNFILWFILDGAMFGFCLSRLMYLDFDGKFCATDGGANAAAPGECYTYKSKTSYLVGIKLHLFTIIPAGLLVCFQFVPKIRHKLILFHRINGYIVILLSIVGTAGALMIARVSFAGGLSSQILCGLLAIMFLGSLGLALYNIKMLQLEQHRAWMLRAWIYAASIITNRVLMALSALIISSPSVGPYYLAQPCDKLSAMYNNVTELELTHPICKDLAAWTAVEATFDGKETNVASVLSTTFGPALWLGLAIHAIGVEIYVRTYITTKKGDCAAELTEEQLHLTPAEAERLRNVSYQRQLEAGFKDPGRAGLTADRIGDAPKWTSEHEKLASNEAREIMSE